MLSWFYIIFEFQMSHNFLLICLLMLCKADEVINQLTCSAKKGIQEFVHNFRDLKKVDWST